jgi:hydrogenase/urease accessory protein HupE
MPRSCDSDGRAQRRPGDRVAGRERWKMPLVYVVLVLMVVGICLWLINAYVPMASSIKSILNIVVVVAVCVWVLQSFGLWNSVLNYRVPR